MTDAPPPGPSRPLPAFPRFPKAGVPSRAAVVAAAGAVVVGLLAYSVGEVLATFLVGLILAYLLDFPVTWMAKHGVPRALGALISIAVLALAVLLFLVIVVEAVIQQGAAFVSQVPGMIDRFSVWYASSDLPEQVRVVFEGIFQGVADWARTFDMAAFMANIVQAIFGLLGSVFTLMVLPFFLFYVLKDRPTLANAMWASFPVAWRGDARVVIVKVIGNFGTYVRAESILMVILGVITWAGLMLLSITVDKRFADFALFLAIIAAIGELIPNFGPIIALIPALMFAATISPAALVATLILYLAIMFLEGQILVPNIEGKQFAIHPAWVLVLILAGLALIGPLGAILALPLAATARDVFGYVFGRASGDIPNPSENGGAEAGGTALASEASQTRTAP